MSTPAPPVTPTPAAPAAAVSPAAAPPKAPSTPAAAPPPAPLTGDLQDNGSVRRDGVRARSWNARGGAKILGDVEVETSELAGIISIRGTVTAQRFRVRGTLDAHGATNVAGPLDIDGTALLDGPVQVGSLTLKGSGKIGGAFRATEDASWKGRLEVVGGVSARGIDFEGSLVAGGDLVAATITGRLKGASTVPNIRATQLRVTRPGLLPPMQTGALRVVRIDATEAHLEGVEAEFVKAERITLGPGCHIAAAEGRLVSVHPSSHVGPESRSPRPYGLSR